MYNQLKLDNQLCFRLYTAQRLLIKTYTPHFSQLGITYPQYLVLMLLWEKDHRMVSDITEHLRLETNTVTPLLQRMEKQGLIVRTPSQTDSRQRIISLTDTGRDIEEQIKEVPNCLAREIVNKGISTEQLTSLVELLDELIDILDK